MLSGLRRKDASQCVPQQEAGQACSFKEEFRANLQWMRCTNLVQLLENLSVNEETRGIERATINMKCFFGKFSFVIRCEFKIGCDDSYIWPRFELTEEVVSPLLREHHTCIDQSNDIIDKLEMSDSVPASISRPGGMVKVSMGASVIMRTSSAARELIVA